MTNFTSSNYKEQLKLNSKPWLYNLYSLRFSNREYVCDITQAFFQVREDVILAEILCCSLCVSWKCTDWGWWLRSHLSDTALQPLSGRDWRAVYVQMPVIWWLSDLLFIVSCWSIFSHLFHMFFLAILWPAG